jgi:hypothetical protein
MDEPDGESDTSYRVARWLTGALLIYAGFVGSQRIESRAWPQGYDWAWFAIGAGVVMTVTGFLFDRTGRPFLRGK